MLSFVIQAHAIFDPPPVFQVKKLREFAMRNGSLATRQQHHGSCVQSQIPWQRVHDADMTKMSMDRQPTFQKVSKQAQAEIHPWPSPNFHPPLSMARILCLKHA